MISNSQEPNPSTCSSLSKESLGVFCGHMIDNESREVARFPSSAESSVYRRIQDWLVANPVRVAFSGAACGADILFLEAALESGVEIHILLPFAAEDFIRTSVTPGGPGWLERFQRVLFKAKTLTIVNDEIADVEGSVFDFTNRMVAAKGVMMADALGLSVNGLTVWNGLRGDGGGGTADAVSSWLKAMIPVHVIDPLDPARDGAALGEASIPPVPFPNIHTAIPNGSRGEVSFFAHFHFAGYSRFPEKIFPVFQRAVLNPLALFLTESPHRPTGRYGFGADYVIAFKGVRSALETASGALETVMHSLHDLDTEIAPPSVCLNVGPVQLMVNPLLNQYCHEGGALLRAARIVRQIPPGKLFCTEPFAALSSLEAVHHYCFVPEGELSDAESGTTDRLFTVLHKETRNL